MNLVYRKKKNHLKLFKVARLSTESHPCELAATPSLLKQRLHPSVLPSPSRGYQTHAGDVALEAQ